MSAPLRPCSRPQPCRAPLPSNRTSPLSNRSLPPQSACSSSSPCSRANLLPLLCFPRLQYNEILGMEVAWNGCRCMTFYGALASWSASTRRDPPAPIAPPPWTRQRARGCCWGSSPASARPRGRERKRRSRRADSAIRLGGWSRARGDRGDAGDFWVRTVCGHGWFWRLSWCLRCSRPCCSCLGGDWERDAGLGGGCAQ
ncbi:hypothetical protein PVAP13_5NG632024 [Panicum virgatum]|uniref:Uncharacterized protein n=1 Tax=Panicum virgatum TaxID=38727 RepID=A0A8T0S322_PANVG|nr:hypothetical protein PVAP13_5NG632024 [Panicum virgatum]